MNYFNSGYNVGMKAKKGERLQMSSFHSSFRNREEDVWVQGFRQGLGSNNNNISNKVPPKFLQFVPQENENTEPPVDQVQNMEEGAGPGLDPTKSYKMYCVQFNKEEYKSISKQILQGRRQLEKREKEGRPAGIFVNANVKKRRQEKVETVKEYIQRREMEEKEKKENKKKEREDQDKDEK